MLESETNQNLKNILDNVRTFDVEAVEIAIIDGTPDNANLSFSPDCVFEYANPVPLLRDNALSGDVIGCATLYMSGKTLFADIFVRYDCGERLDIEAGNPVYPSMAGAVLGASLTDEAMVVSKAKVTGIVLSDRKNIDPRIGPVR